MSNKPEDCKNSRTSSNFLGVPGILEVVGILGILRILGAVGVLGIPTILGCQGKC